MDTAKPKGDKTHARVAARYAGEVLFFEDDFWEYLSTAFSLFDCLETY